MNYFNIYKGMICVSFLLSNPILASDLSFTTKVQCSSSTDCNEKAYKVKRADEAGKFILLKLKALEQLDYKKQKKSAYMDSKETLSNMVELFVNGSIGMPGVFGGWVVRVDGGSDLALGALLLRYEIEESREEDPYGIDRLYDYKELLAKIKKHPDYLVMKFISNDPKKLTDLLSHEAKEKAKIVQL